MRPLKLKYGTNKIAKTSDNDVFGANERSRGRIMYPRLDARGRRIIFPSTAMETYHGADLTEVWGEEGRYAADYDEERTAVTNPADVIAALDTTWRTLLAQLPPIPTEIKRGHRVIAPCESPRDYRKGNCEFPQLNTVHPYQAYSLFDDSCQSPWWQDYALVEDHFARVNTAMTRGKPVVRVGVIHPVESYWLHWGPSEQTHAARQRLETQFRQITDWLLKGSVDFDFISESLLPSQCEAGGAPLRVGEMAYDVVIVPGCETLRSTTLDRLEAFHAAGGRLIFLGDAPAMADALPTERGEKLYRAALNRQPCTSLPTTTRSCSSMAGTSWLALPAATHMPTGSTPRWTRPGICRRGKTKSMCRPTGTACGRIPADCQHSREH